MKVVLCFGATYFVTQKNSPTMPQVVRKKPATCTFGALERQCPSLHASIGGRKCHCVATDAAASNTMTEVAIVRSKRQPRATRRVNSPMPQQRQDNIGTGTMLEFGCSESCTFDEGVWRAHGVPSHCGRGDLKTDCASFSQQHPTTPLNGRGRSWASTHTEAAVVAAVALSLARLPRGDWQDTATVTTIEARGVAETRQIPCSNSAKHVIPSLCGDASAFQEGSVVRCEFSDQQVVPWTSAFSV